MEIDLQIPSAAIFSFLLLFLLIVNKVWRSKSNKSNSKLPPGPWKLPLIGNMHQLGAIPHRTLAQLSNLYGPLMHIKLGELSYMVVSSPEMAKAIMRTHDLIFANRPAVYAAQILTYGFKGMSFSPYGSYWMQMRKICNLELLSPRRVESFRSIREEEVSNLIKMISMSEGSSLNLSMMINSFSYGLTSHEAFGGKSEDQEKFISLMKEVTKLVPGFSFADLYPSVGFLQVLTGLRSKVEKLHQELDMILENIVRSHINSETKKETDKMGEDLVDVLLKLQKQSGLEHPLSDNNIKATILVSKLFLEVLIDHICPNKQQI